MPINWFEYVQHVIGAISPYEIRIIRYRKEPEEINNNGTNNGGWYYLIEIPLYSMSQSRGHTAYQTFGEGEAIDLDAMITELRAFSNDVTRPEHETWREDRDFTWLNGAVDKLLDAYPDGIITLSLKADSVLLRRVSQNSVRIEHEGIYANLLTVFDETLDVDFYLKHWANK